MEFRGEVSTGFAKSLGRVAGYALIVLSFLRWLHALQLAVTSFDTLPEPVPACNAGCRVVAIDMQMQAASWEYCCVALLVVGVG